MVVSAVEGLTDCTKGVMEGVDEGCTRQAVKDAVMKGWSV